MPLLGSSAAATHTSTCPIGRCYWDIVDALGAILAIYFLSVTGHMPDKFPTDQWIEAVRWHGDTKIAAIVHTEAEWADAKTLLARLENVVVEAESKQGAVVWSGVGISRILSPGISRSDRIKKSSRFTDLRLLLWRKRLMFLAPLEALKPCAVQLPGASARRALEIFGATHIPPSHRRMPHVLWTDSMTLIWNLLMGGRMGRYTGSPDTLVLDQRIDLRGFSAGRLKTELNRGLKVTLTGLRLQIFVENGNLKLKVPLSMNLACFCPPGTKAASIKKCVVVVCYFVNGC